MHTAIPTGPEEQPKPKPEEKATEAEVDSDPPIDEVIYDEERIETITLRRIRTASSIARDHLQANDEDSRPWANHESQAVRIGRESMQRAAYEFIESVFRRWEREETGEPGDCD